MSKKIYRVKYRVLTPNLEGEWQTSGLMSESSAKAIVDEYSGRRGYEAYHYIDEGEAAQ
jgi:hypothetical protein